MGITVLLGYHQVVYAEFELQGIFIMTPVETRIWYTFIGLSVVNFMALLVTHVVWSDAITSRLLLGNLLIALTGLSGLFFFRKTR